MRSRVAITGQCGNPPDVEGAGRHQEPDNEQLNANVPMGQPCEKKRDQAREDDPVLAVEGEKVTKVQRACLPFANEPGNYLPLIAPGRIDSVAKDQRTQPKRRDCEDKKFEDP